MPTSRVLCVDASALVDLLLEQPRGEAVAQVAAGVDNLVAPDLVNAEVIGALRRRERSGAISTEQAAMALAALVKAPLHRLPTSGMLEAVWDLRHSVAPGDACYVVAARALGIPLLTADRRLARAPDLGIPVITV